MNISSQDQPKAILLGLGILVCIAIIGSTVLKSRAAKNDGPTPAIVSGNPERVAVLEPQQDPMQYVRNLEKWSQPPLAPAGDPFREVLPRHVAQSLRSGIQTKPVASEFGSGLDPWGLPPMTPTIDYPEILVQGVVADEATGTSYAVLEVNKQVHYAKPGEVLEKGVRVNRVSEVGVWITAGKEQAFIEVSKSYKPTGMPPPEAAKPSRRR